MDVKNSASLMIFQARNFGFVEGWMAAINTLGLLNDSPFRSTNRVPLPEDFAVDTQTEEQGEDNSDEEKGAESLESRELLK